ncbi:MAG TPA: LysR substrate-binding domain-containing protein [Acidimicrobiales bacterium]|nr:LysR substrate-binding domain-containing protein [Acidimicrobiales bacterium]
MDVRQLSFVLSVADEGTFTRAAEVLEISQPSLSQGIRALEAELGVELFDRRARPVRLTAAGEALVEPARRAVRDLQTARAAVDAVRGLEGGHLDLVSLPTLSIDPVAGLVGRFRQTHPAVGVRIREPDDAASVAIQVRSGAGELGACDLPLADPSGLVSHRLVDQSFAVVLPPRQRLVGDVDRPMSAAALAELPLVTTPPGTSTRIALDQVLATIGRRPEVAVETELRESVVPLVLSGAGAAFVPDGLADSARRRGATVVQLDRPVVRQVGLIHRDGSLSPAATAFLALALPAGAPLPPSRPRARRR